MQDDFDDDLTDLFVIQYPSELLNKGYVTPLRRLIEAMVNWDVENQPNNFRLEVIAIIQKVFYYRLIPLACKKPLVAAFFIMWFNMSNSCGQ